MYFNPFYELYILFLILTDIINSSISLLLFKLMQFAQGKIVMVLEGGYNLKSIANSVLACAKVLLQEESVGSIQTATFKSTWRVIEAVICCHPILFLLVLFLSLEIHVLTDKSVLFRFAMNLKGTGLYWMSSYLRTYWLPIADLAQLRCLMFSFTILLSALIWCWQNSWSVDVFPQIFSKIERVDLNPFIWYADLWWLNLL